MDLALASGWFARTSLDGAKDGVWYPNVATVTWLPHDRFVSDQEFGHKVRNALAAPSDVFERYPLMRVAGEPERVYMVRSPNIDRQAKPYQMVVTLHEAAFEAIVTRLDRPRLASGVEGLAIRTEVLRCPCDVQPVTFVTSDSSPSVRYPDQVCVLPRGTDIDSTMMIEIPQQWASMEVRHTYEQHGLTFARGVVQRKTVAERNG